MCFCRTGFTSEAAPTSKLFITEEMKDRTFHRVKYLDPPSSESVIILILTGHTGNQNEPKLSGTNYAYKIHKVDKKKESSPVPTFHLSCRTSSNRIKQRCN